MRFGDGPRGTFWLGDAMRGWRRGTRQLAASTGLLATVLALMVWGAASASAGGPTSVLVTSPESAEASALYYPDKAYGELEQLLGPSDTGSRDEPAGGKLQAGRQINVTWLAHDIWPWRMDRVFPGESGTGPVWIHTSTDVPDSMNGYWHRADHPAQLRSLLKQLGVTGKSTGDGYTGIFPAPWTSQRPSATATPGPAVDTTQQHLAAPARDDGSDRWTGWWWALPGVATGAVLALGLRPRASWVPVDRWRRARESAPRKELRDL
jgi:hypothetical protein